MEKLMKVLLTLGMALTLTHCAEKKDNNNQAAPPVASQYIINGSGQCVAAANPTVPVPQTYCTQGIGGGQYYNNPQLGGQCVAYAAPTVPVSPTLCTQGAGGAQVCNGQYYWCPNGVPQGGMPQAPQCMLGTCQTNPQTGMNNCRGYPNMYTQAGQPVTCQ